MTYLTLYKKCILNNSYTEVFNMKKTIEKDGNKITVLDDYLSTLEQFRYDDDFIYAQQAGSFQIELYPVQNEDDIYSYNYLKIQEIDDDGKEFKRYCFIDNITKIASNIVSISYSEDIWSSYSGSMEIRDGVICNKLRNPAVPYYLPIPYDGNNQLSFIKPERDFGYMICCQLQLYRLAEEGEVELRTTYTTAIAIVGQMELNPPKKKRELETTVGDTYKNIINHIVALQSKANIFTYYDIADDDKAKARSFEVDNFVLLPIKQELINYVALDPIGYLTVSHLGVVQQIFFLDLTEITGKEMYNTTLTNDFKTLSFGTLLSQYKITQNGSDIPISVKIYTSGFDLKVILELQNKKIDITNDLIVKTPFDALTSEQNTLRKIQREMAITNGVFGIVQGTLETGVQIAGAIMSGGTSLAGGTIADTVSEAKYRYSNIDRQLTSEKLTTHSVRNRQPSVTGMIGSTIKIANGVSELVFANKPKYSSTQGTFTLSDGGVNGVNNFMCYKIVPDNEEYINSLLKRVGYTVFMRVLSYDEVFNIDNIDKYDIIKMDTVTLYGNFPQNINYELTEILKSGIRVFNTQDVEI